MLRNKVKHGKTTQTRNEVLKRNIKCAFEVYKTKQHLMVPTNGNMLPADFYKFASKTTAFYLQRWMILHGPLLDKSI